MFKSVAMLSLLPTDMIVTGNGEAFNFGDFLESIPPTTWASIGLGLCIGLSVAGAAWGIFITGTSILSAGVRAPRIATKNMMSIIFCEIVAVYGLIVAIIFLAKLDALQGEALSSTESYRTGFAIFWGGIIVGMCSLICGVSVGMVGSSAALADAADPTLFIRMLIIEIFCSIIGLFGLIAVLPKTVASITGGMGVAALGSIWPFMTAASCLTAIGVGVAQALAGGLREISNGLTGQLRARVLNVVNGSLTHAWLVPVVLTSLGLLGALAVEHRKIRGKDTKELKGDEDTAEEAKDMH
ncbi:uncharacterized protein JN550_000492 [Neoarthrinium moseri]|uniref:uncharacterized protein n=1 Tax=Neoarthrinium moseri TaxID=1658444 RepID=UPI001FDB3F3A|nr:uncharacterized protein JN550_000492 [Neoarthrinium moseri]KAI1878310.1 hypothetical protein JN550_000492 [Neoarthrinium moseri]